MTSYLTDEDLAERFGVTASKVAEWRNRYGWPHMKLGRSVRYTEADVREIERIHHMGGGGRPVGLPGQTALSAARSR